MANVSIAILGLGRTGASAGLALKRYNAEKRDHQFAITGYDTSRDNVKNAQAINAINKVENRPESAIRDKDIILITAPYGEVEGIYGLIGSTARPGAVVIDMSPLKQRSLKLAEKYLPKETHVICATPVVNPKYLFEGVDETKRASEDFFDKGVFMLMPSVRAVKEAIALASDFANIIGSRPHYVDPAEHDALAAGVEATPALIGLAYFRMMSLNSGWDDAQRMTNPAFGMLTRHLFDTHPDDLRNLWLDSGANLTRNLDDLIEQLQAFRAVIANHDRDALEGALVDSSKEYEIWINRRYNSHWREDEQLDTKSASMSDMVGSMFGTAITSRLRGGNDEDEK
jgi:prephenate dehydrogenase